MGHNFRPRKETLRQFEKAEYLVRGGISVRVALKQCRLSTASYYKIKKLNLTPDMPYFDKTDTRTMETIEVYSMSSGPDARWTPVDYKAAKFKALLLKSSIMSKRPEDPVTVLRDIVDKYENDLGTLIESSLYERAKRACDSVTGYARAKKDCEITVPPQNPTT